MSVLEIQDDIVTYLRAAIKKNVAATIESYAGEFDVDEIKHYSFKSDAVFIATLGWMDSTNPANPNGKDVRMAAFIATQHASSSKKRMKSAIVLCELVESHLIDAKFTCREGGVKEASNVRNVVAENLYERDVDEKKHALWMLSFTITTGKPKGKAAQLYDWLVTHLNSKPGAETLVDMT